MKTLAQLNEEVFYNKALSFQRHVLNNIPSQKSYRW